MKVPARHGLLSVTAIRWGTRVALRSLTGSSGARHARWSQRGLRRGSVLFLLMTCTCLVMACGHSSSSAPATAASSNSVAPSQAAAGSAAPGSAAPGSAAPGSAAAPSSAVSAAAAGCGTYCQQAGNSAGSSPAGNPCGASGCLPCPASNCLTVNSGGATASNGVITVSVTCNLSTTCQGAFLLCLPNAFCEAGPTEGNAGGRLAGSDFTVSGGSTSDITVALTALGEQVTSGISGFDASVFVGLLDYGAVSDSTSANFRLASDDPPTFPAGATANCGGAVFAGPAQAAPSR